MADDESVKGHGGKSGRQSTVVSMSAHKSRHIVGNQGVSKKLSNVTLFHFSPLDAPLDETAETSTLLGGALPCENTPFEHDLDSFEATARAPGRKFLRWGLEDEGPGSLEPFEGGHNIFDGQGASHIQGHKNGDYLLDDEGDASTSKQLKGRNWHHKTSRSGSVAESFYHAFHGLQVGFVSQRNVRIHCAVAVAVFTLALILQVDTSACLALILATGFVLFAEYVNTALEYVTDIQANYRYHRLARQAKDTAAAAVLIAALTAVMIGAIVFIPRIFALLSEAQP